MESLLNYRPDKLPTEPKICCRFISRNCGIKITSLQTSPQCL